MSMNIFFFCKLPQFYTGLLQPTRQLGLSLHTYLQTLQQLILSTKCPCFDSLEQRQTSGLFMTGCLKLNHYIQYLSYLPFHLKAKLVVIDRY